ncbi:ATP-binding protein [uncultured Algimonas sp.]|uniref:two-component system sensor histidine kinase NtrB n=1 Tax=uncultured Algimonas sp. TaxID=1547920 RepID=UPI0026338494|nr:ATP-binding protein [uncultured Algimonas sp.]
MSLSLIEDWPFPVFQIDEGRILFANQAAQEWTGDSVNRMRGRALTDMIRTEPALDQQLAKSAAAATVLTNRACTATLPNGTTLTCHVTIYPVEGGTQGVSFWMAGLRPREGELGAPIVSGMGRLIAHELKNPLAGIKGAAQLLRDDVQSSEGRALLDLIGSEIDRIRRLADRMETLGDRDPDQMGPVNIHTVLRQARTVVQSAEPRLVFTERYDPSLPNVRGDSDTLMQAVLNLIRNAQDALRETAAPEIELATRFRAGVTARSREGRRARHLPIQITVSDNGSGVSDDLQDHIFQPFVTTKRDGQGLGLALVSKVAKAHGGLVEVRSRPGRTSFSVLLPDPTGDVS